MWLIIEFPEHEHQFESAPLCRSLDKLANLIKHLKNARIKIENTSLPRSKA